MFFYDKLLIKVSENDIIVYGTSWNGKAQTQYKYKRSAEIFVHSGMFGE